VFDEEIVKLVENYKREFVWWKLQKY
jgi:hypothetical protein